MVRKEQEGISEEDIGSAVKQISLFKTFIEREYLSKLTDNLRKDKYYLEIDYNELSKFNPALAEQLDRTPEDTIKAAELAIEQLDLGDIGEEITARIRFFNLPKSANIGIGEVRKEHFDGFYQFEGLVVKVGDITAGADIVKYECGSCGNVINVLQLNEEKLHIPQNCGCGRKKGFREISKTWKNVQHIIVEEYITDYTDKKARPTTIKVILENDLANEKLTKKLQPGRHIRFTGIVQSKQIKESIFFSFRILCNHIVIEDKSLFNLKVPENYIKKFKEMKNDPNLIEDISESIFHGIEGQTTIKKILAVSRARGVKSYHQDGRLDQRDTINVGMVGDPGTAKSQMGKMAVSVDVVQMTVSGKGVSGPGLTSTTTHDKELGCWCVEIGAGPRCTKGSLFIDEVDKIDDKDTSALNEGMTNLAFITAKAGGNPVTLPLDTNMIMAANPEGRKFDPMIDKYRQITLKPDFRDRSDIWVAVEKIVGTDNQNRVIGKIISRFSDDVDSKVGKYNLKFLQYYYAWIIQTFKPKISKGVGLYAKDEISKLMNQAGKDERSNEISYRLVENIIRFGIAIAKILQKDDVTKEDINLSIEFQKYGFKSLDMLDETGQVSVEKIQHEIPVEVTRKKYKMIDIIKEMYDEAKGPIEIADVLKRWVDEGNDKTNGEEWIEKLNRNGDTFSPKPHFNIRPI